MPLSNLSVCMVVPEVFSEGKQRLPYRGPFSKVQALSLERPE